MKNLLFSLCFFCLASFVAAQTAPRFQKYEIGTTGSFVYMPGPDVVFEETKSEDGSSVYTASVTHEKQEFGFIYVELKEKIGAEESEDLLINYLDFLQNQLGITGSAGYGKGHTLENYPEAKGVIDYWEDEQNQYYVKGWITPEAIAVFLVIRPDADFNYNINEMYTGSIRFSEE